MNDTTLAEEVQIYDAVKDLSADDVRTRVHNNADACGISIGDDHLDVILTLVEHYKQTCQSRDCHAAFEHLRFLNEAYAKQGGGKYLNRLFEQQGDQEEGVLTCIHRLTGLPDLHHNVDAGFGTVF